MTTTPLAVLQRQPRIVAQLTQQEVSAAAELSARRGTAGSNPPRSR